MIDCLKERKARKDEIIIVGLMLNTDETCDKLCEYLKENPDANILEKTIELTPHDNPSVQWVSGVEEQYE
jgi:hypothetical protein